jgi:hypothetical protein
VTTPTTLPHVDALTAALEGVSLTVYLGGAPDGVEPTDAQPYIVLYPLPGTAVRASLADNLVDFVGDVQLTCVGLTAEQALNVHDRASAALATPLAVNGRTTWKPEPRGGQPAKRDDDRTPPCFYAISLFRLRSIPQ